MCLVRFLKLADLSGFSIVGGVRWWFYSSVRPTEIVSWWWELLGVRMEGARSRVGVGRNFVMGIWVGIDRGVGRIIRVKGTSGFVRFVCKGLWNWFICGYDGAWRCSCGDLVRIIPLIKVNSVASDVVALFELHWIFIYIWIGNWCILVRIYIQGFQYIFCMVQGVDNCNCYPLIHVCNTFYCRIYKCLFHFPPPFVFESVLAQCLDLDIEYLSTLLNYAYLLLSFPYLVQCILLLLAHRFHFVGECFLCQ